ncbi:unnamed protein product [Peronospora farinosa]|uniref:Retrovirus-related Pol polyprotein from transposon TNT 1-94-like beta-barrel domain-containing protein n=1 Tax=Peronospora farinosa TaxID=134698 RepID=A0AAV0SP02_9STRA|nr:unnamed protein product [Peronospora farinosa]CAI5704777.1 unnamed protein product [Peronospora farinosa]
METQAAFAFSIGSDLGGREQTWILDSSASWHPSIYERMLADVADCMDECNLSDGRAIEVTKVGQVTLQTTVDGVTTISVYYPKRLSHNLLLYCKLEEKEVALSYEGGRRYLKYTSDGSRVFEAEKENSILIGFARSKEATLKRNEVVYTSLLAADTKKRNWCIGEVHAFEIAQVPRASHV